MHSPKFEVRFLEEAATFIDSLEGSVRDKIIYNITKARFSNDNSLFKKLTDDIWEFRTVYKRTQYRLFAFWDKSEKHKTLVISTHGLIKKTDKTPKRDLERAERLRKEYFDFKEPKA
jgi:phage-related protein